MCPIKGFQESHESHSFGACAQSPNLSHLTANHQDDTSSAFFEATRDPNVFLIWIHDIHDCSGQLNINSMNLAKLQYFTNLDFPWNKGICLPKSCPGGGKSQKFDQNEWTKKSHFLKFPWTSTTYKISIMDSLHQQFSWKNNHHQVSHPVLTKKNQAPPGPHSHTWPWPMLYWPWLNWLFIMKITQLSNYIGGEGTRKTRQCFPTIWTPSGITIDKYHHITIIFSINPDTPKTVETLNTVPKKHPVISPEVFLVFDRCHILEIQSYLWKQMLGCLGCSTSSCNPQKV